MTDSLGRPLLDYHTLDQCECGDVLIHTKRYCVPNDPDWVREYDLLVSSWECPECGVTDIRYETRTGRTVTYDDLDPL